MYFSLFNTCFAILALHHYKNYQMANNLQLLLVPIFPSRKRTSLQSINQHISLLSTHFDSFSRQTSARDKSAWIYKISSTIFYGKTWRLPGSRWKVKRERITVYRVGELFEINQRINAVCLSNCKFKSRATGCAAHLYPRHRSRLQSSTLKLITRSTYHFQHLLFPDMAGVLQ